MSGTPPGPSGGPVTRERAVEIARAAIAPLKPGTAFVLLEDETVEKDWGWVFRYGTPEFAQTRDPRALVPGTGPFVVERADGAVTFLSTSVPPARAIAEYERRRQGGAAPQRT
jgi:hypothetical protein